MSPLLASFSMSSNSDFSTSLLNSLVESKFSSHDGTLSSLSSPITLNSSLNQTLNPLEQPLDSSSDLILISFGSGYIELEQAGYDEISPETHSKKAEIDHNSG